MEFINIEYNVLKDYLGVASAVILFKKKDGTNRVILCTRNKDTSRSITGTKCEGALIGHDKRHTIATKTLGVIDLAIGETRAVPIDRIMGIVQLGILNEFNCGPAFDYYGQAVEHQIQLDEQQEREQEAKLHEI